MRSQPNVLLLTVDSLRKDRVTDEFMPYAASLAKKGIWFDQMISTAPATAASFVGIMASRYYSDVDGIGLPETGLTTLAEALPDQYFRIGHSTNQFTSSYYNYDRGFNAFTSPTSGLKFAIRRHFNEDGYVFPILEWLYHHYLEFNARHDEHRQSWWSQPAERVNEAVLSSIAGASGPKTDQPWFAWIHHMDPHHPLEPPEEYLPESVPNRGAAQRLTRQLPGSVPPDREADLSRVIDLYDAECRYWDDECRRLHERLPDNTLVVIVGDHGELLGEHKRYGHPHEMWEELIRVPCIIYHPDLPSAEIDSQQSTLDLAPTLLALVGASVPGDMRGEPIDIRHPDCRESAFGTIETPEHVGFVRRQDWKWIRHRSRRSTQKAHGELLFETGEPESIGLGKDRAKCRSGVVRDCSRAFSSELDTGASLAVGRDPDKEAVRRHLADLGYLDQQ